MKYTFYISDYKKKSNPIVSRIAKILGELSFWLLNYEGWSIVGPKDVKFECESQEYKLMIINKTSKTPQEDSCKYLQSLGHQPSAYFRHFCYNCEDKCPQTPLGEVSNYEKQNIVLLTNIEAGENKNA